jgi:hypothetical protein
MDNKYVMSVIRLPLHIHEDGTYTSLHDFIHMGFEPCATLPAIQDQSICMKQLDELIRTLHPPKYKDNNTVVGQAATEADAGAAKEVTHTIPPPIPQKPTLRYHEGRLHPQSLPVFDSPTLGLPRDRNSRTTTFKNYAALTMQKQNKYSRKNLVT